MHALLKQIRDSLREHLTEDPQRPPLGGVEVFHCCRSQHLRNVPIRQATAVLVISGQKAMLQSSTTITVAPGELLLLPAGCDVEIGNHPVNPGEEYLALAMTFPGECIEQFSRSYGQAELASVTAPLWHAVAPEAMVAAIGQWLDWCRQHPVDPLIARHRQVEILLLLARAGIAANLLLERSGIWRNRVAQLLALDPARAWNAGDVCRRLGVGESTLRRYLQQEQCNFREVLEETRMLAALALLQDTFWPIGQVAEAVGYQSHSRFSDRFRRRFGISPTSLKQTRESESEQRASG